jgi:membrane protease YdiL (CAAX protease family)
MTIRVSARHRDSLLAVACAGVILLAYQFAAEWGNFAQLAAHALLVAAVWRFRAYLPASPTPKPVAFSYVAAWMLLWLFILIFLNVLPIVEYADAPMGLHRLLLNLPLIARLLVPLAAQLLFAWFLIRRFRLKREHLSLGPVCSAGVMNGFLLLLAFPLLGLVLSGDAFSALLTLNPNEQLALGLDAVIGIGSAFSAELLFRGAFFALLRSRLSPFNAWIAQAVLFGLSHIFVGSPVGAIGPGLVFGLSVLLTRSVLPGVAAHVLMNVLGQIQAATFTQ